MPNTSTYKQSFNGGEVAPDFYGQIGDGKYQSGVATMRNFIALPHGPAQNRPGTKFIRYAKSTTNNTVRLIPFVYSTSQTFVIEMGNYYLRFHTNGATVLFPAAAAYNAGTTYSQGDLVTYGGRTYYYYSTVATSGNRPDISGSYWHVQPLTGEYEIPTYIDYTEIYNIRYAQSNNVLTLTSFARGALELRRYGNTDWRLVSVYFTPSMSAPTGITATPSGTPPTFTYSYKVTAVNQFGAESRASSSASCANDLTVTAHYNTITWSAVSGALRYNVYKEASGVYGYIGQAEGTSFKDDNIAADFSKTTAISFDPTSTYGKPQAVTYYEQRRVFANYSGIGSDHPQLILMTQPGTESNMDYSLPSVDTDALRFSIASREVNAIQHMVPLQDLIVLSDAGEWRVSSVDGGALTPSTVQVKPQSYVGSSSVRPVSVNNNILFTAARGGHVRELAYSFAAGGYLTGDLSLRATHLFDNLSIADMTLQKAPQQIVWMVSSNGDLLGLTYVPEQQLAAWHQHDTLGGTFRSVCAVSEGNEDAIYVAVYRTINGVSNVFIERFASRLFEDLEDAWFVDCGLSIDNTVYSTPYITISGGTTWGPADVLTITATSALFAYPATTDVGDEIVLTDTDGTEYTLRITSTTSTTVAKAIVDKTLPVGFRNVAKTGYCFARDTIAGLDHLEGQTVSILGDGAVRPQCVVTGGKITLDKPVCKAIVGLPITADVQTLPLAMGVDNGYGQGRPKNINRIALRTYRSSGIFAGPSTDKLVEYKQRTTEPYGTPPSLKSDELDMVLSPSWSNKGGQLWIRQTDPLPLTLVSIAWDVSVGN